ncbi:MAG: hypothetical protein H0X35_07255 [Pseudonocardiales bacterium]|nr:hypothetical protein [Pseudonocardiales bacterium]
MDRHDPITRYFPLVARFRPACLPLSRRIQGLVDLADRATQETDQGLASAVFNQAALVASDVGLPDLARQMCHQHAAAYLAAHPLPAMSAIRGLEPVVNLARLHIRAGHPDAGLRRLLAVYHAVDTGTAAQFERITVPANLTRTDEDRREVRAWLWRVLLADGTRALTCQGRWTEALAHVESHCGIGTRMLDGRQVAVLAALINRETRQATELLAETTAGDPWEQAVAACLEVLLRRENARSFAEQLSQLVMLYTDRTPKPGTTVFETRLGLAVLHVIDSPQTAGARHVSDSILHTVIDAENGYAAREVLQSPIMKDLTPEPLHHSCRAIVRSCALDAGVFADVHRQNLIAALQVCGNVIRRSLGTAGSDPTESEQKTG